MTARHVLHVIQRLSRGGAGRSLLVLADASRRIGGFSHSVLSLLPPEEGVLPIAVASGVAVVAAPTLDDLRDAAARADVVQLHYWNTPELWALLDRPLPPARIVLRLHVGGQHPPHVLTEGLLSLADVVAAATPLTSELPVWGEAGRGPRTAPAVIIGAADLSRLARCRPVPHTGVIVGYVGTVDFTKLHPRYVPMSAAVIRTGVRFAAHGLGGAHAELRRQAAACGAAARFHFGGYVEDIARLLGTFDILGYPLCVDNYSASDLVLQEAMAAGVPPVVLPWGGAARLVEHGVTGLVAQDETDYTRLVDRLAGDADERRRLGRNAAEHARACFGAKKSAEAFHLLWERLMSEPKRPRRAPQQHAASSSPAARFLATLGSTAPQFAASAGPLDDREVLAADRLIAGCSPVLASPSAGGVMHWRLCHPGDPWLRLWAGLVLLGQGRPALAAAEFDGAARLGAPGWRAWRYLAESAARAGAGELAQGAMVEARARGLTPARDAAVSETVGVEFGRDPVTP